MANIQLTDFCAEFPVYNARSRSLKIDALNFMTGGKVEQTHRGITIVKALTEISLKFSDGDRVALFGHNGSGKSTLLRAISGVYAPTQGRIKIDGEVSSMIDISLGIDQESTGRENIYIRGALIGLNRNEITTVMDSVIEFSELNDFIDLPVRTYSSGMHLRLAFAAATMMQPEILLMDEWLSVGDSNFSEKASQKLNAIIDKSKILIMATHSRAIAEANCNLAVWLEKGCVKLSGDIETVADAYWNEN